MTTPTYANRHAMIEAGELLPVVSLEGRHEDIHVTCTPTLVIKFHREANHSAGEMHDWYMIHDPSQPKFAMAVCGQLISADYYDWNEEV